MSLWPVVVIETGTTVVVRVAIVVWSVVVAYTVTVLNVDGSEAALALATRAAREAMVVVVYFIVVVGIGKKSLLYGKRGKEA